MAYKNITTATNAILGRARGTQNNYIRAHYGAKAVNYANKAENGQKSIYAIPDKFEAWLIKGLRFYESKGFEFVLIEGKEGKAVRIMKDGKYKDRLLTDFKDEWENEYLPLFPSSH